MADPLIAVTGSTGAVGGRVARGLTAAGAAPRLVVRDPSRTPELPGAEVRQASGYGDRDGMRRALEGAHTLFLVPGEEAADRVDQHRAAVDAAVDVGVRRIVYLSFLGAASDAGFLLARDHWATEEHIRAAGVPWTFLRMSLYIDFVPRLVTPEGFIAGPGGNGRVAAVARADVADSAAAVLRGAGHDGEVLELTGREAFTLAEAANRLTELTGRRITYREETLDEARASRSGYGAPEWLVEAWISTYTAIASGEVAKVTGTVVQLTGREPMTLADYVREHPDCLDHVVA
jgi:NAD(P)H dehydrogenase (quinone)